MNKPLRTLMTSSTKTQVALVNLITQDNIMDAVPNYLDDLEQTKSLETELEDKQYDALSLTLSTSGHLGLY